MYTILAGICMAIGLVLVGLAAWDLVDQFRNPEKYRGYDI